MATLKFQNKRIINAENYKDLDAIYLAQMASCATSGFGPEFTTPEDFLAESGDGDMEEAMVELWDIIDTAHPEVVLYDCWVYLADTANVFYAHTSVDTEAGMIQWYFDDLSADKSKDQLCKDLQKAFDAPR